MLSGRPSFRMNHLVAGVPAPLVLRRSAIVCTKQRATSRAAAIVVFFAHDGKYTCWLLKNDKRETLDTYPTLEL